MTATLKDVARESQVSVSTASLVLRGEHNPMISAATRDRILAVAQTLGYQPNLAARSLRRRRTRSVGLVVHHIRAETLSEPLYAVEAYFRDRGYDLLVGFSQGSPEKERRYIDKLCGQRVDGLLLVMSRPGSDENLPFYAALEVPIVLLDGPAGTPFACVRSDRRRAVELCVEHLYRLGRRRLVLVQAEADGVSVEYREAFTDALGRRALPCGDACIPWGAGAEGLARNALARRPRPDAVLCSADGQALELIEALFQAGARVPHDVAVMGLSAAPASAYGRVPLSTIDPQPAEMARAAAETLLARIECSPAEAPPAETLAWPPLLLVRRSCGALAET